MGGLAVTVSVTGNARGGRDGMDGSMTFIIFIEM